MPAQLEPVAHSLPAFGKPGDRHYAQAWDVLLIDLAGILCGKLLCLLAAEQDVRSVLHTDHVRWVFRFQP